MILEWNEFESYLNGRDYLNNFKSKLGSLGRIWLKNLSFKHFHLRYTFILWIYVASSLIILESL